MVNCVKKLKEIRKEKNLTQTDCAKLLGVKQQYISMVENGTLSPSVAFVERYARAIGCRLVVVDVE